MTRILHQHLYMAKRFADNYHFGSVQCVNSGTFLVQNDVTLEFRGDTFVIRPAPINPDFRSFAQEPIVFGSVILMELFLSGQIWNSS